MKSSKVWSAPTPHILNTQPFRYEWNEMNVNPSAQRRFKIALAVVTTTFAIPPCQYDLRHLPPE